MRALWLEDRRLSFRADAPRPAATEARVKVRVSGICSTDLELLRGYYPFAGIPGHEFVGVVELAPGAAEWVGRRVVGEINAVCGACAACRAGRRSHCERRTVLGIRGRDGAFAESLALPVTNLHAVPEALADEIAVFTEPLAAALQVQEQIPIGPTDRVVVIGDGRLGQLIVRTLVLTGCDLLAIGHHATKLDRLAALGVSVARPDALQPGEADVVVECTGNEEGVGLALAAVRPRGTVVLKSTYHGEARLNLSPAVVGEVTLVGSRCGPFDKALALLASGRVDVGDLVSDQFALEDGPRAFARAAEPSVLKVLLRP